MKMLVCVIFVALLGSSFSYKSYSGYQVIDTGVVSQDVIAELAKLELDARFDFWSRPHLGHSSHVMTSPENVEDLHAILHSLGLESSSIISDLEPVVQKGRSEWENIKRNEKRSPRAVTFDRYMELDEILDYLDELAEAYPDLVTLTDIGTSYEGRPLRLIKISNGSGKKGVFLDAGIHPREYMGPPLALKMIYELVENYAVNKEMVDALDWFIIPIMNPDGYVFCWTEDRFWRKTRRPNPGSDCVGTDPNRNFDFQWGLDGDADMCSQAYRGPVAFSESESAALGKILKEKGQAGELVLYLATHTFGSFLMFPYGYTMVYPPNTDALQAAGDECAAAIKAVNGAHYVVGQCANVYFHAYGNSFDYAYGVGNISYAYTWELTAGGATGFDPPNEAIAPMVNEVWEGTKVLAQHAARNN